MGSQEDLSLNMHSQAEHELHTSGGKEGRGQRRGTRQAFLRQPRCGAQGSTLQQTWYARIGERSCIGELTLHRVRADPRRHQRDSGGWHLGGGPVSTTAAADGRGPVGAVGQRGLRRHAAAVDAERRASITRPIVSISRRPTSRNPSQTQSPAPKSQRLRSRRCPNRQYCQRATH